MRIVWGDGARRDFDNAIAFLQERSPAGARRIGDRILEVVDLLKRFPEIAPTLTEVLPTWTEADQAKPPPREDRQKA